MNVNVFSFNNAKIALLKVDELKRIIPQKKNSASKESYKRVLEKQGVQVLLSRFLQKDNLYYNLNGKPFLDNGVYISISHSNSLVGIAWSSDYNIGLDIEEINERVLKVEQRYIHEQEIEYSKTLKDKIKIWGIKEALIKIHDDKSFNLKNDLQVKKIDEDKWIGCIAKNPSHLFEFSTFEFQNNIICINTNGEK